MTKFILKETEAFAPNWEHTESFNCLGDAQARMKDLYHQNAVEGNPDAVFKAEYNERSAIIELNDGNVIAWDIEEI